MQILFVLQIEVPQGWALCHLDPYVTLAISIAHTN
jgi:hypothetical protein